MLNKKRFLISSLLIGTMIVSIGCAKNESTTEQSQGSQMNQVMEQEKNVIYGKIASITDNEIVLNIGTMNMGNKPLGERPQMPENGERPEKPQGEAPQMPQGGEQPPSGERPEMPENGEKPQRGMGNRELITLTGEEKKIVIDDSISITFKSFGKNDDSQSDKTISLSDLKVDDVLKIKYKEDEVTIDYIEVMSMPSRPASNENKTEEKQGNA